MKIRYNILKDRKIPCLFSMLLIGTVGMFLTGCAKSPSLLPDLSAQAIVRANGGQVIRSGKKVRIVLPSDCLFHPLSAELYSPYENVLNQVVTILNNYHIVLVKVAGYTGDSGTRAHRNTLTDRQARAVQSYLSNRGIKARLIYAVGRGDKNPVAHNSTAEGRASNRRIEISFQFYTRTA